MWFWWIYGGTSTLLGRALAWGGRGKKEKKGEGEESLREDEYEATSKDALDMLTELIRTILRSVSIEHTPKASEHAVAAVPDCIEEFDNTVPMLVLENILLCIGSGPVVYVTNPAAVEAADRSARIRKNSGGKKKIDNKKNEPPIQVHQTNQSYVVASNVAQRTEDRASTPVATLLNSMLNREQRIVEWTQIVCDTTDTSLQAFEAVQPHL